MTARTTGERWTAKIHDSHLIDGRAAECRIWAGDQEVAKLCGPDASIARHVSTGFRGERVPGPNARLIAAAPELRDALRDMLGACDTCADTTPNPECVRCYAIGKARALLARLDGDA